MKLNNYTIKIKINNSQDELFVINHGASEGINSDFMNKLQNRLDKANKNYIFMQMPYKNRGEERSSGPETIEELNTVSDLFNELSLFSYSKISFIGKSLGGLIFSRFITQNITKFNGELNFTQLGFLVGEITIPSTINSFHIIQGENDKYGSLADVNSIIEDNKDLPIKLTVIKSADHSYRDSNKNPIYHDLAIDAVEI
jgi:predicted alpha/beta-hydrolase family hydrolase